MTIRPLKYEELLLREIYTDNFLSDTLQTSLSIFEYDKNTKLSSIGGLEFNISSFIIYNGRIDFILEKIIQAALLRFFLDLNGLV